MAVGTLAPPLELLDADPPVALAPVDALDSVSVALVVRVNVLELEAAVPIVVPLAEFEGDTDAAVPEEVIPVALAVATAPAGTR